MVRSVKVRFVMFCWVQLSQAFAVKYAKNENKHGWKIKNLSVLVFCIHIKCLLSVKCIIHYSVLEPLFVHNKKA